jgi:class 3 adenylate cyclase
MPTAKSEPEIVVRRGKTASAVIASQGRASLVYHRFLSHPQERTLGKGNPLLSPQICANAVILFADLRGYTRISEFMSPQDLVPLLNEYFSLLTGIAYEHGGTVFHLAGDCLLVGFGVPREQADGPERAIDAAQEMLIRFGELAQRWRKRAHLLAGLGIGINKGSVAAADIGSRRFMSYTLVGDAVNVASRLCQRARAGEVVFSAALKQSLDAHRLLGPAIQLQPITLRGRSEQVDVFCMRLETRLDLYDYTLAEPAGTMRLPPEDEDVLQLAVLPRSQSRTQTQQR